MITLGVHSYLVPFFMSTVLSLIFTRRVRDYAEAHKWVQAPVLDRHVHSKPVPRLGGVAIYLSVLLVALVALLVSKLAGAAQPGAIRSGHGILGLATIIFLLGVYDDLHSAGAYLKFAVQALVGALLYFGGHGIQQFDLFFKGNPLRTMVGLPLTILWVLLVTNAFNLIDGLDGLAAGSALFSTLVLFIVSLFGSPPLVTFFAVTLAGAILGFLRYNFHPASIFMGDSGSLFIGFMLSALALTGLQKAPTMIALAIPVLSFGLPILDVAFAVVRRFVNGQPLFSGDREHIHHRLLKRGLSHRQAVYILYAVSAGFGVLSLALLQNRQNIAPVLIVVGVGVWMGIPRLRYVELVELQDFLHRTLQRKRLLANNLKVRRGIESLIFCIDFRGICKVLEETLEPVGFDGIVFEAVDDGGLSERYFAPLKRREDGNLLYFWKARSSAADRSWELKLELTTGPGNTRGAYFSVFRSRDSEYLLVDLNLLGIDFRRAVSEAFLRVMSQAEIIVNGPIQRENQLALRATSGR